MSDIHNGDIVLVTFPFTDLKASKLRPALVISRNKIHDMYDDYTLMFISSVIQPNNEPCEFILESNHRDFPRTGLKVSSVFKGNKIATLHRDLMKRRLGKLSQELKEDIQSIIDNSLGLI